MKERSDEKVIFCMLELFVNTQYSFKPYVRRDFLDYCLKALKLCDTFDDFYNQLFLHYLCCDGPDSRLCMIVINYLSKRKDLFA